MIYMNVVVIRDLGFSETASAWILGVHFIVFNLAKIAVIIEVAPMAIPTSVPLMMYI